MAASGSNDPPKATAGDVALKIATAATKGAVSIALPGAGAVAELLDLVRTPLQRRQEDWLSDLAARLAALEEARRLDREHLGQDEAFLDAVARGIQAAMRTGQAEKREALRNAALNIALGTTPDEGERELFLDMVERFTAWHLRLLKAFQDPGMWARVHAVLYEPAMSSTRDAFLEAAFPELRSKSDFYSRVWSDLFQARLVNSDQLGVTASVEAWKNRATTILGDRFLDFIAEPVDPQIVGAP